MKEDVYSNEHQQEEKVTNTDRFPCPACGGNMNFDPESQTLLCPFCTHRIEIETIEGDIHEYDLASVEDDLAVQNWGDEKRVIQCDTCGAKTVVSVTDISQFCAFCGSSHVIKVEETPGIAPESVIPFQISKEKAMGLFHTWIKNRPFAPKALKSEHRTERITGVYIPYWTYDADTYSTYSGQAGTYYYVTETHWVTENGKRKQVTRQVRKTRWRPTSGTYAAYYDDVLINASKEIEAKILAKLEPYHLNELQHYKPQFLSGFLAERYSVGVKAGWEWAKERVRESIHRGIVAKINADEVRGLQVHTSYNQIKYKHILLPVWISAYMYKGKVYQYMINGQTGEVQGQAPVSPWKIALLVAVGLVVVGAAFWYVNHR